MSSPLVCATVVLPQPRGDRLTCFQRTAYHVLNCATRRLGTCVSRSTPATGCGGSAHRLPRLAEAELPGNKPGYQRCSVSRRPSTPHVWRVRHVLWRKLSYRGIRRLLYTQGATDKTSKKAPQGGFGFESRPGSLGPLGLLPNGPSSLDRYRAPSRV